MRRWVPAGSVVHVSHAHRGADTNIILIVVVQLVLSLLFVVLCAKLRRRLHIVFSQVQSTVALHASRKIAVATWVCVVCFLLRAFFWLYEPVTGDYPGNAETDKFFYPWWYYQVPELVPVRVPAHVVGSACLVG